MVILQLFRFISWCLIIADDDESDLFPFQDFSLLQAILTSFLGRNDVF